MYNRPPTLTCAVYLAPYGRLVCGQDDGSIAVLSATQAATVLMLQSKKFSRGIYYTHNTVHKHIYTVGVNKNFPYRRVFPPVKFPGLDSCVTVLSPLRSTGWLARCSIDSVTQINTSVLNGRLVCARWSNARFSGFVKTARAHFHSPSTANRTLGATAQQPHRLIVSTKRMSERRSRYYPCTRTV